LSSRTASAPNRPWLTDLTEHSTKEGKLYLCAITDVWSNRIVGYSMADRMESSIAVAALDSAVAAAAASWPAACCTRIGGRNFDPESCSRP
jgi:transposase InsO family protein